MLAIHAVADKDIAAAAAKLTRPILRLMTMGNLPIGRLTVAQVDAKLAAAERLTALDRIAIKVELSRFGLMTEDPGR
jgi:hypothetical protein